MRGSWSWFYTLFANHFSQRRVTQSSLTYLMCVLHNTRPAISWTLVRSPILGWFVFESNISYWVCLDQSFFQHLLSEFLVFKLVLLMESQWLYIFFFGPTDVSFPVNFWCHLVSMIINFWLVDWCPLSWIVWRGLISRLIFRTLKFAVQFWICNLSNDSRLRRNFQTIDSCIVNLFHYCIQLHGF